MTQTVTVAAIEHGTVIDHIPAGYALPILDVLKLNREPDSVFIGIHLASTRMGKKDLIKIENRFLTAKEIHGIAVFAPHATINNIRDFTIEDKIQASLPAQVEHILVCPNGKCITHDEDVASVFFVQEFKKKVHVQCKYCEKLYALDELKEYRR